LVDRAIIDGSSPTPIQGSAGVVCGVTMVSPFLHWDPVIRIMAKSLSISEEEFPDFRNDMKGVSKRSFRKAMVQANRAKTNLDQFPDQIPVFFVSGEKESATMHKGHQVLAIKNPKSGYAWYPSLGHAWMVKDGQTQTELIRSFFLKEPFPPKLINHPLN